MKNKKKYPEFLNNITKNTKNEHIIDLIFEDNGIKDEEIPLEMCNKNYRDFINFHFKKTKETEKKIFYKFKNNKFIFDKLTKKIKTDSFDVAYVGDMLDSYLYNNRFRCNYMGSQNFFIADLKKNREYLFKRKDNKKKWKFCAKTIKLSFLKQKIEKSIFEKLGLQVEISESWIKKDRSLKLYCKIIETKDISLTLYLDKNGISKLYYRLGFYTKYKIDFKNKKTESDLKNKGFENEDGNQFFKLFRDLGYFNLKDDITINEFLIKIKNDKLIDIIKINSKI